MKTNKKLLTGLVLTGVLGISGAAFAGVNATIILNNNDKMPRIASKPQPPQLPPKMQNDNKPPMPPMSRDNRMPPPPQPDGRRSNDKRPPMPPMSRDNRMPDKIPPMQKR